MTRDPKIFLLAAEPSGDRLGADLAKALKSKQYSNIVGIGGPEMDKLGLTLDFDIRPIAILGYTEAIKAYPMIRRKVKEAVALVMSENPDAVILIDSWGFMIRVASTLKKRGYQGKIIKYVAPRKQNRIP